MKEFILYLRGLILMLETVDNSKEEDVVKLSIAETIFEKFSNTMKVMRKEIF